MKYGYKASAEQFGTRELLDYALLAERLGFEIVAVSDHFQPWRHHGGHAPLVFSWLGALAHASERLTIGTSVLTPMLRYHPSVVAQGFGTIEKLAPGRVYLGVGTGEAMNEVPATGTAWPGGKERRARLAEAVTLIRELWTRERVTFDGTYYRTDKATVYERPDVLVPIYLAASGPLAGKLAGRIGDGVIQTSGKAPELYESVLGKVAEGAQAAGKDPAKLPNQIEIKVSYDTDLQAAKEACTWWAALGLSPEQKQGVDDPLELERLADADPLVGAKRFIVSDDPDEVVEKIAPYVDLGFTELVFHGPGNDQARFLELFARDVLPKLRDRFS
ncbi:TIGR03557 family F420-dependent LLM class oxidoreductase [Actinopolymorpha pittospori]|uniref:Coenzyme F420-dependent glucose-6-phosphate dehydrogenase n=1 Tax=Actinopolymorpha pittospori TaxID=648752 RepID=A0A927RDG2_9ACTN|nr:coenzyme F420-dependent glucose-6-phosphate dehydrogenase [Actinopolymorpha pittospori]